MEAVEPAGVRLDVPVAAGADADERRNEQEQTRREGEQVDGRGEGAAGAHEHCAGDGWARGRGWLVVVLQAPRARDEGVVTDVRGGDQVGVAVAAEPQAGVKVGGGDALGLLLDERGEGSERR